MADNLTITIGADASQLRAQLAVAQSEMRSTTREMNALANQARKTGSEMSFAKLGQAAAQFEKVSGEVAKLKGELGGLGASLETNITRGFAGMGSAIREPLDALAMMSSRLRQTAEIAGITFAADKILEWSRSMAEAGERAVNTAAALAMSLPRYVETSGAMRLLGASAEEGSRTLEHLQRTTSEALGGNEKLIETFGRLGITQQQLKATGGDLLAVIRLISA